MKQLRVLSLFSGTERAFGGCEIYRNIIPSKALNENGHIAQYEWLGNLVKAARSTPVEQLLFNLIAGYDIFVFPRAVAPDDQALDLMYRLFSILRAANKKIVYEVDDDYTNDSRWVTDGNPLGLAKWADAITVTTPYLAQLMRQKTHRPTYILPNCLTPVLWRRGEAPDRHQYQDDLLIGLTGSTTHAKDWEVVVDPLLNILNHNANVRLVTMGYCPDKLRAHEKTTTMKWQNYNLYSQVIRGCDIILAPVIPDDIFNLSKSPIKAVEGQAAERKVNGLSVGAAVLATDNPVYRLAIKHNETGLLVQHTEESWFEAIQAVIDSPEKRLELQQRGYKSAWKRFDITQEWREWAKAYQAILAQNHSPTMSIKRVLS